MDFKKIDIFSKILIFTKFSNLVEYHRPGCGITIFTFHHIYIDLQYTLEKVFCGFS